MSNNKPSFLPKETVDLIIEAVENEKNKNCPSPATSTIISASDFHTSHLELNGMHF